MSFSDGTTPHCTCTTPTGERRARWRVFRHRYNTSTFNGGRYTPSDYSDVLCLKCGRIWRTKAAYVETLAHATDAEKRNA